MKRNKLKAILPMQVYGKLARYSTSALVFLLAVTPISDVAVRLGLAKIVKPAAEQLLPYEAPAIAEASSIFEKEAWAPPSMDCAMVSCS